MFPYWLLLPLKFLCSSVYAITISGKQKLVLFVKKLSRRTAKYARDLSCNTSSNTWIDSNVGTWSCLWLFHQVFLCSEHRLEENYLFGRNSYSEKSFFVNFRIKGESTQSKQADMKFCNSELFIPLDSVISLNENKPYFLHSLSHSQHEKCNINSATMWSFCNMMDTWFITGAWKTAL